MTRDEIVEKMCRAEDAALVHQAPEYWHEVEYWEKKLEEFDSSSDEEE